jgi:hypothetical protein
MRRELAGACLCGGVRYVVDDEFEYAFNCHCSQCRRATGSAFKPFGGIPRSRLRVLEGKEKLRIYGDELTHDAHCGACGSLLYSVVRAGAYAHVTYGTLADVPTRLPSAHICVASKAAWYAILDGLPQHAGLPPSADAS